MKKGLIWFGHLLAIFSVLLFLAWLVRGILDTFVALYFYRFLVLLILTTLVYLSPLLLKKLDIK